jgi:hypothetical protein
MQLVLMALIAVSLGCASSTEGTEPAASEAAEPTSGAEPTPQTEPSAEPSDVPAEPIPSTNEGAEAPGAEAPASGGRMAFTTCPEERPEACTREYRPVCGEVDNGVRCITTPCDSTDQKEFGNACTACADAKTTGYWPVACAELGSDAK